MSCKIHNNSEYDITDMKPLIRNLYGFAKDRFKFKRPPVINFMSDASNHPMLGKTAHYDPTSMEITVYVDGRHPKDMMRSIAHELIHHKQNLGGMFDMPTMSGEGYAQKDPHLRKMEEEAYLEGNMCFRDWEDGYKSKHKDIFYERRIRKMSTKKWKNKELSALLNERWGFSMNLDKLTESKKEYDLEEGHDRIFAPSHYCLHHVVYEGREGYTVDHNWNEKLQKVTKYDVKFEDGTIIRNIHESKLTALEAFSESSHSGKRDDGHPPVKKEEKKKMVKDPKTGKMVPDYAIDGKGANDLAEEEVEEDLNKLKGGLKDYMMKKQGKKDKDEEKEEQNEIMGPKGALTPERGAPGSDKKTMADLEDKDKKKKQVKMKEAEMTVDELAQKIRDFATIEKLRQALKRAEEMEKEDKDDKKDS
tara:strand:- start:583 stop:1839 length:1257 start_codon:yes stop_codon:yes gene_type:complete